AGERRRAGRRACRARAAAPEGPGTRGAGAPGAGAGVVAGALESLPAAGGVAGGCVVGAVVGVVAGVVVTDVLWVCRDGGTAPLSEVAHPAASTDASVTTPRPGTILHHAE